MGRLGALAAAALVAGLGTSTLTAGAHAAGPTTSSAPAGSEVAGEASIELMEPGDSTLRVLVSLPEGTEADLDAVGVTLDGQEAETTASYAADAAAPIRRTAVLAIDTSLSMEGDRIEAAEAAARVFVETLPDDVLVGVVTFDGVARTDLAPTLDRAAALDAVSDLDLDSDTALYDGALAAVELTGTDGLRQVLVLSDGEDSVGGSLPATVAVLQEAGVTVDAVALDQDSTESAALSQLSAATGGSVVAADPESLESVFSAQAEVIANQLVLDVTVPPGVDGATAPIAITLGADQGAFAASALAPLGDLGFAAEEETPTSAAPVASDDMVVPSWVLYAGVGVFGLGLLLVLVLLVPRRAGPVSAADRVTSYAEAMDAISVTHGGKEATGGRRDADAALTQAKDAATQVLRRNQGLEARISARLEGAGSALKPAEWLLVHVGVFLAAGVVGLLIGGGNLLVGILFLVLGAVGPWMYLGVKRSRRQKAFGAALPDTLQLISTSLSAGLSLAQSCDTVSREARDPVASEFKRVLVETRLGVALDDALADVADRFDSKDFRWAVMAIRIQREVGGNLAELLDTVAGTMREREYLRRQVDALAAEGKLSAWVIGGLPPAFLLYLLLVQRDYVLPMFTEPRGWVLLGLALLLLSTGVFWMSRMVKVKV
ncbi:type II secretion system F family protein [Nocardioides alkalitolerans]|uniref:type II secretion system F family protein n=1 Tax=Nocardioides alkalitolerans TaxID=281714 RepID=UPI0003F8C514|nr:type II secretion system F family protein [Nocardioides alkalitolerans]